MVEIISEAIVLDRQDSGEYDSRVFLYTKDFGKIAGRATSLRKINSKLSHHLEPLKYIMARLVSSRDIFDGQAMQLVDALIMDYPRREFGEQEMRRMIQVVDCLYQAVPAGVPDKDLWDFLHAVAVQGRPATVTDALIFLGFDPRFSRCERCQKVAPDYFLPKDNFFICRICAAVSFDSRGDFVAVTPL